jgi:hypothetical protein
MLPKLLASLLAVGSCLLHQASAQSAQQYLTETGTNGTLLQDRYANPIDFSTATNLVSNTTVSSNSPNTAIGFDFFFMGRYYSHFVAGTNGMVALGLSNSTSTIISASAANDLTRTFAYPPTANTAPVLAVCWDRIYASRTGATIRKIVTGTSPNRCCVIEWNGWMNAGAYNGANTIRMQARLYEATGVIEYVYGSMGIVPSSSTVTASIGFTAGTSDNSFLALQNLTAFPFTSIATQEPASQSLINSNVAGDITGLHNPTPGNQRYFRFTPPALVGSFTSPLTVTNLGATTVTLNWNDDFSNELSYSVLRSTDQVNWTPAALLPANSNRTQLTGLSNNTLYYFKVMAHTEGGASSELSTSATTACTMNGTYQIGSGGDYLTLTDAMQNLRLRGVTGSVIFEINSSYDGASERFPIYPPRLSSIPCGTSTAGFQLTVRPHASQSAVTLPASSDSAVFYLDSVTYFRLDGRAGGTGNSNALTLSNNRAAPIISLLNSSNNTFEYINISAGLIPSSGLVGTILLRGTAVGGCDNNTIANNLIASQTSASDAAPVLLNSTTTGSINNESNQILHNRFANFSRYGIWLQGAHNNWSITGNSFYHTSSIRIDRTAAMIRALYNFVPGNNPGNLLIHQNSFGGSEPNAGGTPMRWMYRDTGYIMHINSQATITNNRIARIRLDNDSAASRASIGGIYVDNSNGQPGYLIQQNQLGGADPADSIQVIQRFGQSQTFFTGMGGIFGNGVTALNDNEVQNLHLYGLSTNAKINTDLLLSSSNSGSCLRNTIRGPINCRSNGLLMGIGVYSANGGSIQGNQVSGMRNYSDGSNAIQYGIRVSGGSVDSISGNRIFDLQHNLHDGQIGNALYGMHVNTSAGGLANAIIANNVYGLLNGITKGALVTGIHVGSNMLVARNFIHSLQANIAAGNSSSIYGIQIPDKQSTVQNNMIRLGYDTLGNSLTAGNAQYIGLDGGDDVRHNTIFIGGDQVGDGFLGSICYTHIFSAQSPFVHNNIFVNARSNANANFAGRHQTTSIGSLLGGNNNIYWYPGTGGIMGTYGSTRYNTLAEWQSVSGADVNSQAVNPLLVQPTGTASTIDLHIQPGSPADAAGTSTFTVTRDFDNQSRIGLTPVDIGADAGIFSCPVADAGLDITVIGNTTLRLGTHITPNPSYTYQWTGPSYSAVGHNPVVIAQQTGTYVLTITVGGCVSRDTMELFALQLSNAGPCPSATSYSFQSLISAPGPYQWQIQTDTGFMNLTDVAPYTGTQTSQLDISPLNLTLNGKVYRCITPDLQSITQTLRFANVWTNAGGDNLWSNPANWSCGSVPDNNTTVIVNFGNIIVNINTTIYSLQVSNGATVTIQPGINLTILH